MRRGVSSFLLVVAGFFGAFSAPFAVAAENAASAADQTRMKETVERIYTQLTTLPSPLLRGLEKEKAHLEEDARGLRNIQFGWQNNSTRRGKGKPQAADPAKPFLYLAVSLFRHDPTEAWTPMAMTDSGNIALQLAIPGGEYHLYAEIAGSDPQQIAAIRTILFTTAKDIIRPEDYRVGMQTPPQEAPHPAPAS